MLLTSKIYIYFNLILIFKGMDGVGLEIDNLVNLAGQANIEIAMRFVSGLKSDRAFYSDLNGLQVFNLFYFTMN